MGRYYTSKCSKKSSPALGTSAMIFSSCVQKPYLSMSLPFCKRSQFGQIHQSTFKSVCSQDLRCWQTLIRTSHPSYSSHPNIYSEYGLARLIPTHLIRLAIGPDIGRMLERFWRSA